MSIADTLLCLPQNKTRQIWQVNPKTGISYAVEQRWWSRDPGNCNCSANSPLCVTASKNIQNQYKNLVLQHKIASSIQNVSGLRTKSSLYNYYAKGNKNSLTQYHTFAIQNTKGFTNPNNLNLPLKGFIGKQILLCPLNFKNS